MKTYQIKPIKWEKSVNEYEGKEITYQFNSIFGSIRIEILPRKRAEELGWDTSVLFKYCFAEYYDEGHEYYSTVKEAKERANKFYLERLLPALKETKCK